MNFESQLDMAHSNDSNRLNVFGRDFNSFHKTQTYTKYIQQLFVQGKEVGRKFFRNHSQLRDCGGGDETGDFAAAEDAFDVRDIEIVCLVPESASLD